MRLILLTALLVLTACGQPAPPPTASSTSTLLDLSAPRFVGRWASSPVLCGGGSWDFTSSGVTSAIGASCTFSRVDPTPDGYDISAVCGSLGSGTPERIQVHFTGSAGGMVVDGGPFLSAALVPCASASEPLGARPR